MSEHLIPEFVDRIRAARPEQPLRIRGGGSKDFYGGPLGNTVLDTRGLAGIVDYQPSELFITAGAGTPLAQVESTLAAHDQMLAFEPPHFGPATIGGCVAAGLSGPRRASAGSVRDYVLGVRIIDGEGRLLRFGGQVMKNVAGYDVSRLMAGSLGTLGLLTEVTLKVLPRPGREITLEFEMDETEAIAAMNRWAGLPLPISASAWHAGRLHLRLSGAPAAIAAAQARLGGEARDGSEASGLWQSLRDQTHAFFAGSESLWRLSLPSTAPAAGLGNTLIEWGGSQRWLRGGEVQNLRHAAASQGGHATRFRGATETERHAGVFHPLPPVAAALNRQVRRSLDPRGVFDGTRLLPDT